MMDELIRWSNLYLLLSATCDEILSRMIEIWMKKHLVGVSNWKIVHPQKLYEEWQIMLGWHLVLATLYRGLQLVLSKTIWIGDTEFSVGF
jgi:hypothetical protein